MRQTEGMIMLLNQLSEMGIQIAIDDFGTGYSSLSYLKNLPIDVLKIDRSFVRDIGTGAEAEDGILAAAIISLGHALHLQVIAEGVETDAQLHFLKRHGCDQVQGFLYGEPVPAEQFAELLARARRKGKRA
ncbi:MAG TPA: EAL domain-containing protein, partial [Burkholderiales bacterium]|nr:EAL domain-containing protein [Burkholderiales bacterium]